MSKRAAIILAVAALLVGVIAGGWSVAYFFSRFAGQPVISSLSADAAMSVAELRRLRAGYTTNVVQVLEIKLDGDLIGLTPFLDDPSAFNRDPMNLKTLQIVKDYRTQFPRKTDSPELDAAADKAFDLLNGQTKR